MLFLLRYNLYTLTNIMDKNLTFNQKKKGYTQLNIEYNMFIFLLAHLNKIIKSYNLIYLYDFEDKIQLLKHNEQKRYLDQMSESKITINPFFHLRNMKFL